MSYSWDFMHKEVFVTSKMFWSNVMVNPYRTFPSDKYRSLDFSMTHGKKIQTLFLEPIWRNPLLEKETVDRGPGPPIVDGLLS